MSPTEAELRAFLHEGEGDVPDATSAISSALRVRYERRRRINTVLSSAAVVAVVATGLTFLFTRTDDGSGGTAGSAAGGLAGGGSAASAPLHGAASGRAAHKLSPLPPATPGPATSAPAAGTGAGGADGSYRDEAGSAQAAVTRVACPTSPTSYALPGGGGLATYGAKQPMFARPPAGMKVCAYSLVSRGAPKTKVLSVSASRTLARIIAKSSALPGPARMCPDRPADANRRIEIISADASGRRLRPVTITFQACGPARVTNGTSVRYLYRLPPWLQHLAGTGSPLR